MKLLLATIAIVLLATTGKGQTKQIQGKIVGFEIVHQYKHLKVFDHIDTLIVYNKYCIVIIGNTRKKYRNTAVHAKTADVVETHIDAEIKIDTLTIN